MWRALWVSAVTGMLLSAATSAQQIPSDQTINPGARPGTPLAINPTPASHSPLYQDLNLLRRDGFIAAQQATVSLSVVDKSGVTPSDLRDSDFILIVNGTRRTGRLHAPGAETTVVPPVVLLVFPPNQPIVHSIAVKQASQYFSHQPNELLPWRVGILDANGELLPFTNGRSQIVADLDIVEHTNEPLRWAGSWLPKAEQAISTMQGYQGAKVILAMNPIGEPLYGENEVRMAKDGPESLTNIAQIIGAHIYIANVGGPDVIVPGGEAAEFHPAQINRGAGAPLLGNTPSSHNHIDNTASDYFAYRDSVMMQTAGETLGGYANSINDLAQQIHRNLDGNYSLDFDLSPEDRDRGTPSVEVRLERHDLRVAILDLVPIGVAPGTNRAVDQKKLAEILDRASKKSVSSPDFRITQHVDYFPVHAGLEPILPMSGMVEWTGPGRGPTELSFVESVEEVNLSTVILEREINAHWDGRRLSWEQDGQLRPGSYVWRVVVHNESGDILSSTAQKISVALPHPAAVAVSSLVLGKSCGEESRDARSLQRRSANPSTAQETHLHIDPMRAGDCRVKPEVSGRFASSDKLRAFVRIYPMEKLEKQKPESWNAKFVLRSQSGLVETEREIPFTADSGSGYLASIELPLDAAEISSGPHTLDVEMRGPGIRGDLKASRPLSILAATP
jgi:hypothetical protein